MTHEQWATDEACRRAFTALLHGDWSHADRLEIEFLNLLVRIGELAIRERDGTPHWLALLHRDRPTAPFVTEICRGYQQNGHSALEWQLRTKCRRCSGRLVHVECRICEGRWWVDDGDDHELVYTDLDGVLLGEHP